MYEPFHPDYGKSLATNMALRSGLEVGEIERGLASLRGRDITPELWAQTWSGLADLHQARAEALTKHGFAGSAADQLARASVGYFVAQVQLPPSEEKDRLLQAHVAAFAAAASGLPMDVERIEIPSEDGPLPALYLHASAHPPRATIVFYPGFDLDKEMMALTLRDTLGRRGLDCVVVDGPGIGEALRHSGIPSRPDYEVPTAAVVDYILAEGPARIGVVGISLGGYYAIRSAAFERRLAFCVAWGGMLDFGKIVRERIAVAHNAASSLSSQLPVVMGMDTLAEAVERVQEWNLTGVLDRVTCPLLILHGEGDRQIPLADAEQAFGLVGSAWKALRVFTPEEGGIEHCQLDEPHPSLEMIADWCLLAAEDRLPAPPAATERDWP